MKIMINWLNNVKENIPTNLLKNGAGNAKLINTIISSLGENIEIYDFDMLDRKIAVVNGVVKGFISQNDYVFEIKNYSDPGGKTHTTVIVSDYQVFLNNGYMSDWNLDGMVYLPSYLEEYSHGEFASSSLLKQTQQDLLLFGLVEDPAFSQFVL